MSTTDELIERTEASSEKMHERMVDVARNLREWEQKLQQLEGEAATFAANAPERERLDFLIGRARRNVDDYRFLFNSCRTALDGNKSLLGYLNGDE